MKQEDLFKKLGLILKELNDQYEFLAQNPQQLSELELELFQANANFLADHVQILKKINLQQPDGNQVPVADALPAGVADCEDEEIREECQLEAVTFSAPDQNELQAMEEEEKESYVEIPASKPENTDQELFKLDQSPSTFEFILNSHSADDKFEFEEKSVDELFNRPLSEEEERILEQKLKLREKADLEAMETEEDEIGPEPFLVTREEEVPAEEHEMINEDKAIIPEVALPLTHEANIQDPAEDPDHKPTLNELLAKSHAGSLNTAARPAVSDLKQAISLNDKLLYIRELFNGYNLAYAEAIEIANKLPNFEAADNFFQKNYAAKNNWAEKQPTVDKFYQVLNERFR